MSFSRSLTIGSSCVLLLSVLALAACAPTTTQAPSYQAPVVAQAPTAGLSAATSAPAAAPTVAMAPAMGTGAVLKMAQVQGFGRFLTDDAGRTLYAFSKDTKDTSNCTGSCLSNWPPYTTQGAPQPQTGVDATKVGTFTRPDGTVQVTYGDSQLYYYAGDKNPGDIKGQGIGGAWHVLSPRGNPMMNNAPAAGATGAPPAAATPAPYGQ
jgi:predicted lipoprotein with Yx(FWY)xxD motif